jgi:uroporphyrinogen decarboxylase
MTTHPPPSADPQQRNATAGRPTPLPAGELFRRDRVLASMNHIEMGRVPIDLSGHRSSGVSAIAYARLREYLGLPERPVRVYDVIQQLAVIDDDVLDYFDVDTIELGRAFALDDDSWTDWTLPNGLPCQVPAWSPPDRIEGEWVLRSNSGRVLGRMPDGVPYFEQAHFPWAEHDNLDRIDDALAEQMWAATVAPPGPVDDATLAAGARRLRASTDRAIIGLFGGSLFETGQFLYRADNFLMLLAGDPGHAEEFLDRLTEMHLANLERFLGAVGDSIDIIVFGDDLGMQTGPMMSPRMYETLFKPRHARMWGRAKEIADAKVMLHCCGGVRPLLDHLIEAGLDAINPVQITCKGMDASELKREFGDRITLWGGGCDTRSVLPAGTPEEVAAHVREQVSLLRPSGGFVFQQVHNILADVPPENIVAMLDAVNS